jgi:hypothetical protein
MSEGDAIKQKQEMTLHSACLPPLRAGSYEVKVKQTVRDAPEKEISGKGDKPTFQKESKFWVSAPRFSLTPSEIYDRYPPGDASGHFSETLPHIVLSRRTLPWERALNAKGRVSPTPGDALPRPWMALLLLDENELGSDLQGERKLETRSVKQLLKSDSLMVPMLNLEPWEETDSCLTLDLSLALFQAVAPTWTDLPYLAHVRQVGHTTDMEAEGIEDEGWFSVVVGNRLPTPGKENHVFLVSIEGLESSLPTQKSSEAHAAVAPDPKTMIRLIVLAHWRFVDKLEGSDFKQLMKKLDCGPLRLALAQATLPAGAAQIKIDADKEIKAALKFGYVPLQHQTGEGHHTVSWYRGPLVPHFLPTEPRNIVYSSADAALRYDPYEGLFDTSYAAAWQLGRLLGLQNQPFAKAVCRLKLLAAQKAVDATAKAALDKRFGIGSANSWEQAAREFFKPPSKSAGDPSAPAPPSGRAPLPGDNDPYKAMMKQVTEVELPLEMRQWLGRLFLLHGLPFGYLVPDQKMLPEESLRFFYLDTTWIAALMDGALSIGRTPESRLLLDKAMAGNFLKDVVREEIEASLTTDKSLEVPDAKGSEIVGHITGFLLRSELVPGSRGVEIKAEDGEKPLRVLRMQRVAKDTILAIYNGQIGKLVITQPPQGIHFGIPQGKSPSEDRQKKTVLNFQDLAKKCGVENHPVQLAARMLHKRLRMMIDVDVKGTKPTGSSPTQGA